MNSGEIEVCASVAACIYPIMTKCAMTQSAICSRFNFKSLLDFHLGYESEEGERNGAGSLTVLTYNLTPCRIDKPIVRRAPQI